MSLKLRRFRVTDFRSVKDSGWIDTDDVAALIGTNESGKTNLLLPLWKLKPAKDGAINPILDYPRKRYAEIRDLEGKPTFVEAEFELPEELVQRLVELTGATAADVRIARVSKNYANEVYVRFPNAVPPEGTPSDSILDLLRGTSTDVEGLKPQGATDEALKASQVNLKAGPDSGKSGDETGRPRRAVRSV